MNIRLSRQTGAALAMAAVLGLAMVEPAAAASIESVLQKVVGILTGGAAKLLAIIAVIIVGVAWMFGFMDLRKAAYVVLGIALVFGATEIVNALAG
ncbi:type IV secretion system protein VirB2 [Ochrobactrum anthropi]|uniref:TrbC/VirB2 family protein n=1 Tax=Brucella anthropi TaxID=529 RepID=UPI0015F9D0C6|nr:TrbC/VirB2 family protein [Brucella anthropi]MBA8862734.1 type IV secretion system protein VirB2 [Brucella anthropi]